MAADDEDPDELDDLWTPFLATRPEDRRAARLREHVEEDIKRGRGRGRAHPPRRAAALSRDQIVRTAIKVADADGAEAVSMRRIARDLNAGTMSLYWHIASKEELLDRMIDMVQGELPAPEPSGDWRADLSVLARNTRTALHRHRWMIAFLGGRPSLSPKSLQNVERALSTLDGLGLDKATAMTAVMTIVTYVLGAVTREVQEMNTERFVQEQFGDLTDAEKEAMAREFVDRVRATGRFPHLAALIADGIDPDSPDTRDERFEFGLTCLLDGFAARLPASPS
ncbi:MAG: TetR/AcrR family transcriptional regulator [Nocardiopsaceae bacterium]|nr:TetR/AcrR family transcriptional regulator [Nocardiopsaceae bacterium]